MFTAYVPRVQSPTADLKKRFAAVTITPVVTPTTSPTRKIRPPMAAPSVALPVEAAVLKDHICQTHPAKLYAFSLAHMRKLAVPPVEIPKTYRSPRARSMVVSGRNVPFTRAMWDRSKRRLLLARARAKLDSIHEGIVYD